MNQTGLATAPGIQLGALGVTRPSTWTTPTDIPAGEATALKLLYDLTDGDNWTDNTNWGTTATANDWFGVTVAGGNVTQIVINTNALNGSLSTWQPSDLTALTNLRMQVNASLAGNINSWVLPSSLTTLYGNITGMSGGISSFVITAALVSLRINSTGMSGAPVVSSAVALGEWLYHNCALSQADVDANLLAIYNRRASFTNATPALNISGTNSAPSGVYQYSANPSTGKEYIYALENDDDGEGFNKWTITYTA